MDSGGKLLAPCLPSSRLLPICRDILTTGQGNVPKAQWVSRAPLKWLPIYLWTATSQVLKAIGYGYGSKSNHQQTAGFRLFHLPGFHFGLLFLTHTHGPNVTPHSSGPGRSIQLHRLRRPSTWGGVQWERARDAWAFPPRRHACFVGVFWAF